MSCTVLYILSHHFVYTLQTDNLQDLKKNISELGKSETTTTSLAALTSPWPYASSFPDSGGNTSDALSSDLADFGNFTSFTLAALVTAAATTAW